MATKKPTFGKNEADKWANLHGSETVDFKEILNTNKDSERMAKLAKLNDAYLNKVQSQFLRSRQELEIRIEKMVEAEMAENSKKGKDTSAEEMEKLTDKYRKSVVKDESSTFANLFENTVREAFHSVGNKAHLEVKDLIADLTDSISGEVTEQDKKFIADFAKAHKDVSAEIKKIEDAKREDLINHAKQIRDRRKRTLGKDYSASNQSADKSEEDFYKSNPSTEDLEARSNKLKDLDDKYAGSFKGIFGKIVNSQYSAKNRKTGLYETKDTLTNKILSKLIDSRTKARLDPLAKTHYEVGKTEATTFGFSETEDAAFLKAARDGDLTNKQIQQYIKEKEAVENESKGKKKDIDEDENENSWLKKIKRMFDFGDKKKSKDSEGSWLQTLLMGIGALFLDPDLMRGVTEFITNYLSWDKIKEYFGKGYDYVKEEAKGAASIVWDWITKKANEIKEGSKSIINDAKAGAGNLADSALHLVGHDTDSYKAKVQEESSKKKSLLETYSSQREVAAKQYKKVIDQAVAERDKTGTISPATTLALQRAGDMYNRVDSMVVANGGKSIAWKDFDTSKFNTAAANSGSTPSDSTTINNGSTVSIVPDMSSGDVSDTSANSGNTTTASAEPISYKSGVVSDPASNDSGAGYTGRSRGSSGVGSPAVTLSSLPTMSDASGGILGATNMKVLTGTGN